MRRHEIYGFGSDLVRGDCQIAFVLTILVIDNDQHFTLPKILDRVRDRSKIHPLCSMALIRDIDFNCHAYNASLSDSC